LSSYTQCDDGLLKAETCTFRWVLYQWHTSCVRQIQLQVLSCCRKNNSALPLSVSLKS